MLATDEEKLPIDASARPDGGVTLPKALDLIPPRRNRIMRTAFISKQQRMRRQTVIAVMMSVDAAARRVARQGRGGCERGWKAGLQEANGGGGRNAESGGIRCRSPTAHRPRPHRWAARRRPRTRPPDYAVPIKTCLAPAARPVRLVKRAPYNEFERQGWKIGSGPIEAMCKTTTRRLKGPGMRRDGDHAKAMIALEAIYQSNLWDRYWTNALCHRN